MDANATLLDFYFGAPRSVRKLECIEMSHPNMSKVYRIVRNATKGVTVMHEDGKWYPYEYYPLRIASLGLSSDLESGVRVDLGDVGTIIPWEIDRIRKAGGMLTKPTIKYRTYRDDNLTTIMDGPMVLEAVNISRDRSGASYQAKAPSLNNTVTGEVYDLDRFFTLRGFLY